MAPELVQESMLDLFTQHGRSKGRHVSSAIHTVMNSLYPDRFTGELPNQVRLNLGNAMERAIIDSMMEEQPDRYYRPGQLEFENVFGTPDLWDLVDWATVEVKLTWASANRASDIEDSWFWRYWTQIKSYCHMAGQTVGYLIIIFINGDYKYGTPGGQPTGMMWRDEWSPEELYENWQMIDQYAKSED